VEEDFYSFEEALRELRLKEEELKRLVSEGEIRAFRQGDTMRLRKTDVHNLRSELSGGEVVDLGGVSEELVFEDDADLETGMATEEISEADTILEDDVEDVGELQLEPERRVRPGRGVGAVAPTRRATTVATTQVVEEEAEEPMWVRGVMILTTFVLVLAMPVCLAAVTGNASGIAKGIAGLFGE
jgi:excisionase family DNA binding protein